MDFKAITSQKVILKDQAFQTLEKIFNLCKIRAKIDLKISGYKYCTVCKME
jgi:hypothetical protein